MGFLPADNEILINVMDSQRLIAVIWSTLPGVSGQADSSYFGKLFGEVFEDCLHHVVVQDGDLAAPNGGSWLDVDPWVQECQQVFEVRVVTKREWQIAQDNCFG